ncbi:hypothetical protein J2I47_07600 [Fibrella sp. HMF5335]|uniref:Uncharacterized protein n=1 Tax=Fibrella rubiginis TaxID=2817060 RepID=A0A939GF92_9BACT|nr:hypothetical protein [Fibrella rubiginis]MBO0936410.1 hypothetical protein [Fibrella rubiginis]
MDNQNLKHKYASAAIFITLLAGVGAAALSYPYWKLRTGQRVMATPSVNDYRIDWLGI